MVLRDYIFGLLVVIMVLLGITSFYVDLYDNYGINETKQNATYLANDTMYSISGVLINASESLNQTGVTQEVTGEFDMLAGIGNTFKVIFSLPSISFNLLSETYLLLGNFGIPAWVVSIMYSIIITFIIFEVLSGILRMRI